MVEWLPWLLLAAATTGLTLVTLRLRRRRLAAEVTPPPPDAAFPLPDTGQFRPVGIYFSRDDLQRLLLELARFQQEAPCRLPPDWVQRHLRRVVKRLIFAGELARHEQLPEGDLVTLYLAVIYSAFVTPEMNPVYHTWYNAALARARLLEQGLTRHAALKVSRAIKEYPLQDPDWGRRLAGGLARIVVAAGGQPQRYDPQLRQVVVEVLEKSEADYEQLAEFISQSGPVEVDALAAALYERFRQTVLVYPPPSTPELWEKVDEIEVLEADDIHSFRQVKVYSVGTPGGNDLDFAVVNVPGMKRRHIAIGPLDLFINDTNAASAILARQTMDAIYARRPLLYRQWTADKAVAADLRGQGVISAGQYSGFKALWHRERGLPWQHYAHKQAPAEEMARLPPQLVDLARPRGGGYNQLAYLLHDVNLAPLPTLDTFFDTIEFFAGQRQPALIETLAGVITAAEAAVERMQTPAARQTLAANAQFLRYFWNTIRRNGVPPEQMQAGFQAFLAQQHGGGAAPAEGRPRWR